MNISRFEKFALIVSLIAFFALCVWAWIQPERFFTTW